jgi:hypothetical protein
MASARTVAKTARRRARVQTPSLQFFKRLRWLDGRPLLDTIEPYRRELFAQALDTFDDTGVPRFNMVLAGRGKKNWKSCDLILAALFKLVIPESNQGNDALILANDEGQAGDDLALAKKLVAINPDLAAELESLQKEIRRRDGRGALKILPARDVVGAHGKTAGFIGFDEIHAYRNYDLFEALAPDPTRQVLIWVTSYDTIFQSVGVPLYDLKAVGFARTDPRMLFSWYSGDQCTDPAFADLEPEWRANPSIASWPEGIGYIEQQRRRLPTHKFRRLHLNLPGAPNGAFFDQAVVMGAVVKGRYVLKPEMGRKYHGFVDMSGGSSDDATLGIAHEQDGRAILDLLIKQDGSPPFNPRVAVKKFASALKAYGITSVVGDAYAGQTFREDFWSYKIDYLVCRGRGDSKMRETEGNDHAAVHKTDLYEFLEPALNAGEVELLDISKLQEQLLRLLIRGASIDHEPGGHDDFANAAAGAIWMARGGGDPIAGWGEFYSGLAAKARAAESDQKPADAALPWHQSQIATKQAENDDLIDIYFKTFNGLSGAQQGDHCASCGAPLSNTRTTDGILAWHRDCPPPGIIKPTQHKGANNERQPDQTS